MTKNEWVDLLGRIVLVLLAYFVLYSMIHFSQPPLAPPEFYDLSKIEVEEP